MELIISTIVLFFVFMMAAITIHNNIPNQQDSYSNQHMLECLKYDTNKSRCLLIKENNKLYYLKEFKIKGENQ